MKLHETSGRSGRIFDGIRASWSLACGAELSTAARASAGERFTTTLERENTMKKPTFEDTAQYKTAVAEVELEHVKDRKAKAAEKLTVEADRTQALKPLAKEVEVATAKVVKAQQNLVSAQGELGQVQIGLHTLNARADSTLAALDADLRDGALSSVREFLDEISGLWDSERFKWSWNAPRDEQGEQMPARERMDQIRATQREAQALLLQPDPEVAQTALAKLKAEIDAPMAAVA